jgi:Bacterial Ig domain
VFNSDRGWRRRGVNHPGRHLRGRRGFVLLSVLAVAVPAGLLVGTTATTVATQTTLAPQTTLPTQLPDQLPVVPPGATVHFALDPAEAAAGRGDPQAYTAKMSIVVGPGQKPVAGNPDTRIFNIDVTRLTEFRIEGGSCARSTLTVDCSSTSTGLHLITGTLPAGSIPGVQEPLDGQATLQVVPQPTGVPPVRLQLDPASTTIMLRESQRYRAQGLDDNGHPLDDLTGQTSFAMIGPHGHTQECPQATCTPTVPGHYTVTGILVADPDVRGTADLLVLPRFHLELDPRSATKELGESQRYTANAVDDNGDPLGDLTGQTSFTMTGSDGTIHRCRSSTCTPTEADVYTVTGTLVSIPGVRGRARLEVAPPAVRLQLDPSSAMIMLRDSQRYRARGVAGNGDLLDDRTGQTSFTMTGPDGTIQECPGATCTPTEVGDYAITGSIFDNHRVRGRAKLQVIQLKRLQLDPAGATILLGESKDYTAQGVADNGDALGDLTGQTRFTLTGPDGTTRVCQQSTCTPAKDGNYTVTGELLADPRVRGTALLHVLLPVDHLQLLPGQATILFRRSQSYTARGVAKDGSLLEDLTGKATFIMTGPDGTHECQRTTCTPAVEGNYKVTGLLDSGVSGTADLQVIRPLDHLAIAPGQATVVVGERQRYTARGVAADGGLLDDVTSQTTFTMNGPDGAQECPQSICAPTAAGDYTVTGTLGRGAISGTASLTVLPRQPHLTAVTPDSTLPGKPVEVRGSVGSCDRTATLEFHGTSEVATAVTAGEDGSFISRFTVPRGTFPRTYSVELVVECRGRLQWVQTQLTVINLAPVAVDDFATTSQDTPVAIAVAANDRNLDPESGHQTIVVERGPPTHGTIQVRSDLTILYTPRAGFLGSDQFQYGFCDNVINAIGQADCGVATVSVTVRPGAPSTTTTGPPTAGPPTTGPPTTGPPTTGPPPTNPQPTGPPPTRPPPPRCNPSAGHIARFQVTPIKGASGARLRITASGDRNLASCFLTVLLRGLPLGPTLQVPSNGSIAAQRSVPNTAAPGISTVALAMNGGQILAEAPFEITSLVPPWWRDLLRLLIGAGAFAIGAAAQAAFRRWRAWQKEREESRTLKSIRIEPDNGSASLEVKRTSDRTKTFTVRIEPHPDPGTQTVQEVTG